MLLVWDINPELPRSPSRDMEPLVVLLALVGASYASPGFLSGVGFNTLALDTIFRSESDYATYPSGNGNGNQADLQYIPPPDSQPDSGPESPAPTTTTQAPAPMTTEEPRPPSNPDTFNLNSDNGQEPRLAITAARPVPTVSSYVIAPYVKYAPYTAYTTYTGPKIHITPVLHPTSPVTVTKITAVSPVSAVARVDSVAPVATVARVPLVPVTTVTKVAPAVAYKAIAPVATVAKVAAPVLRPAITKVAAITPVAAVARVAPVATLAYTKPVQSQFHAQDELGQYAYGYTGLLSSKYEEAGLDGSVRGGYSYVDAKGVVQTVKYASDDKNGFRVAATNLPAAPSRASAQVTETPEVALARRAHEKAHREARMRDREDWYA